MEYHTPCPRSRTWRIYANVGSLREPELRDLDPETTLQPVGFGRDEGLFPLSDRSFVGYRLLQEYFSFPEKFYFFDLRGPSVAVDLARRFIHKSLNSTLEEMIDYEAVAATMTAHTADAKEGTSAFLEKRKAEFKGY